MSEQPPINSAEPKAEPTLDGGETDIKKSKDKGAKGPEILSSMISDSERQISPDQETAYGQLLEHILKNGKWGYKSERDPLTRELAFQSEKVAERLYGHLYRHNPQMADRLWEEHTGHTPSAKFHEKIKGQSLTQTAEEALPELTKRVESVTEGIGQARKADLADLQRQQLPQLSHMLGETKQRQIDYRRKALQQTFKEERDIDGISLLKTFARGLGHGREGMANWRREGTRGKTIQESIMQVEGNVKELSKQGIAIAVNRGELPDFYDKQGHATELTSSLIGKDLTGAAGLAAKPNPVLLGLKFAAQRASTLIGKLSGDTAQGPQPATGPGPAPTMGPIRPVGPQMQQDPGRELNIGA